MPENGPSGHPTSLTLVRRALFLFIAPCALLPIGCSNGGNAHDAMTKSQVIASADESCGDAQRRLDALAPLPQSLRAAEEYLREQAAITREQVEKVRALRIPESSGAAFEEWASVTEEIVDVTTAMAAAAGAGDQARFQQLAARRDRLVERARQAAREYGFKICGEDGPDPASVGG